MSKKPFKPFLSLPLFNINITFRTRSPTLEIIFLLFFTCFPSLLLFLAFDIDFDMGFSIERTC